MKSRQVQAAVVQRADNFIQWISHYPVVQMYTKQRFWQASYPHNPIMIHKLDIRVYSIHKL